MLPNPVITVNAPMQIAMRIGVDPDPDAVVEPFPKEFKIFDSVEFITYEQVHKAFTDEDEFFKFMSVNDITGEKQRWIGSVRNEETTLLQRAVAVSFPGIAPADVLFALYNQANIAGHRLFMTRHSNSSAIYTVFTMVPDYATV